MDVPQDRQMIAQVDEPLRLFADWFAEAEASEISDANAIILSTATPGGVPSSRTVLLKEWDEKGFVFYTNFDSRKGEELATNPVAALLFYWKSQRRQVRIEGPVVPVAAEEADAYFASRPRDSQLGAWASDQSRPLTERQVFLDRLADLRIRYEGTHVPRPPHWSGFRVAPARIEFWQELPFRYHDRLVFTRDGDGWVSGRLFP